MEWMKSHKKILIEIGVFFLFFIVSFLLRSFRSITSDEIWTFGFTYNIRRGLTIYKDYNVLQTPFYFLFASLLLRVFGSYVMTIHLLDSVLMGILGVILYRMVSWKAFFVLASVSLVTPSPYNFLCLFFLFLIIVLLKQEKDNDWLIALIVGLTFMTKQNVGVLLFIPMFFYSKKKIKSLFFFALPFCIISLYLLFKGAFFSFIDYSFLGIIRFQEKNTTINYPFLIMEVGIVLYLIYHLWKSRGKDKEVLYILAFQIMSYPIFDQGHFFVSFTPFLYYLTEKNSLKTFLYPFYAVVFLFCLCYYDVVREPLHMKNDILFFKAPDELAVFTNEMYSYFDGEILNVYGNSELPYFMKLYYGEPIGKFDMMLSGNLGGDEKKAFEDLDSHCRKVECKFMISKNNNGNIQFQGFSDYVQSNYKKVDKIGNISIYQGFKD